MIDLPQPIAELVDVLAAMPGTVAVVLGGSRACGSNDAGSDWDLGLYYRGAIDLTAVAARGTVYPPGSWGRVMNGGAWLRCGGEKVDVILRDLDVVEHWTWRAEQGEFDRDALLGYLAGIPTYSLSAELASCQPLRGEIPAAPFPPKLRPTGVAWHAGLRLLAWSDPASPESIYLAGLDSPGRRIELKSGVRGIVPLQFNPSGTHLAAAVPVKYMQRHPWSNLRTWEVESGHITVALDEAVVGPVFADGGRVLVATIESGQQGDHDVIFYDLDHPDRPPRRSRGKEACWSLAVSPDGHLVASATTAGLVRLFDPITGEVSETIHAHLNGAHGLAFSEDGRRLVSSSAGRETIKVWDVGTRQELLTLSGGDASFGFEFARWSADGSVILAGTPWQSWRAPSWEEIAAAEAKEKTESRQP